MPHRTHFQSSSHIMEPPVIRSRISSVHQCDYFCQFLSFSYDRSHRTMSISAFSKNYRDVRSLIWQLLYVFIVQWSSNSQYIVILHQDFQWNEICQIKIDITKNVLRKAWIRKTSYQNIPRKAWGPGRKIRSASHANVLVSSNKCYFNYAFFSDFRWKNKLSKIYDSSNAEL